MNYKSLCYGYGHGANIFCNSWNQILKLRVVSQNTVLKARHMLSCINQYVSNYIQFWFIKFLANLLFSFFLLSIDQRRSF